MSQQPSPPKYLGPAGSTFWRDVCELYHLEAPDLARLEIACDCLDRIGQAREVLAKDGLNRLALAAWRDAIKLFLSSIRQMGVDLQQTASGRLPALHAPGKKESA
jgi:hypothetical protein